MEKNNHLFLASQTDIFVSLCTYNAYSLLGNNSIISQYITFVLDNYYNVLISENLGYLLDSYTIISKFVKFNFFNLFIIIFKANLFLVILYCFFFLTNFQNYIKELQYSTNLTRLSILNESEQDLGPVDDLFFFAILFLVTLTSFFFFCFFSFLLSNIFIFYFFLISLLVVSLFILTVPVNLFFDYGLSFVVYIKGSSASSNFIKEFVFDIISVSIAFIRFVIQNIRFLFIFLAIFELMEWSLTQNNLFFTLTTYKSVNTGIINNYSNYINLSNSFIFILNLLTITIMYFYSFLHLLFLLLIQISVYIGISLWLFFFLYSTRFLNKYEKFFFKKN